jgi:hypothetical protein
VPEITGDALFGVIDQDPSGFDLPDLFFLPVDAVALAQSPARRWVAVLDDSSRAQDLSLAAPGLHFYRAIGPRHVGPQSQRRTDDR